MLATITSPIPTFAGTIPVGLRMRVVSWGSDGEANLEGLAGWPRVSLARAGTFEIDEEWPNLTTERPGHVGELSAGDAECPFDATSEPQTREPQACEITPESAGAIACESDPSPASSCVSRSVATDTPSVPRSLRGETASPGPAVLDPAVLEPNAELQLLRTPRESRAPVVPQARRGGWPVDTGPRRNGGALVVTTGYEWPGPRFNDHPRRAEWGPDWDIAEIGFSIGDRTVFSAKNESLVGSDGKVRPTVIDLDRGEYQHLDLWVPLGIQISPVVEETHSDRADEGRSHRTGSRNGTDDRDVRCRAGDAISSENHQPENSANHCRGNYAIAGPVTSVGGEISPNTGEGSRAINAAHFPAPSDSMNLDQRRGWRVFDNAWHFGPIGQETLEDFRGWIDQLNAYFSHAQP